MSSRPDHGPDPELLLAHAPFVRKTARALVKGDAQVDDVVQDTFLTGLRLSLQGVEVLFVREYPPLAEDESQEPLRVETVANGSFRFEGVRVGQYSLTIPLPDHAHLTRSGGRSRRREDAELSASALPSS